MTTLLELPIKGMDCADCALTLERGVGQISGVRSVSIDFATGLMQVQPAGEGLAREEVIAQVRRLGYDVAEPEKEPAMTERRRLAALVYYFRTERRARLTLLAGLLASVGGIAALFANAAIVGRTALIAATLVGLIHPARSGWNALRAGRGLDINVLMTLAAFGALAIGEWAEAATVMVLFNLGEVLEAFTLDRTRASVRSLVQMAPAEAVLVAADHERPVPVNGLKPGDRVRVKPGDRLPTDGVIRVGESALDESPITGESLPVDKGPGDPVFAGSVNGNAALLVEVTRPAEASTLARIARLVETAQRSRGPIQRTIDRFARWYTPAVVATAGVIAFAPPLLMGQPFHPWLYRALVLLVVSCPCALVISTPVSILAGVSRAARLGILVKGGEYLEKLARLRVMAFDKTGTLTLGRPTLQQMIPEDDRLLAEAAAVEMGSEHPLALSIRREARHRSLPIPDVEGFTALPGRGARARVDGRVLTIGSRDLWRELPAEMAAAVEAIEAVGQTALILGDESGPQAIFAIADEIRPESGAAVKALQADGISKTILLTGDNARTAAAVARRVGISDFVAGLLPEEKSSAIAQLARQHDQSVAMVGDGINDAPALAQSDLGIAMGASGTDVALETADVVLMQSDLRRISTAIRLGRMTHSVIRQNVLLSVLFKAIFLSLALFGLTSLWLAVFADMGVSLLVTLNGMRLLRFKDDRNRAISLARSPLIPNLHQENHLISRRSRAWGIVEAQRSGFDGPHMRMSRAWPRSAVGLNPGRLLPRPDGVELLKRGGLKRCPFGVAFL